ncbi:MAG: alpha/beta hydrolase [Oxalobacteraceae bacterium]
MRSKADHQAEQHRHYYSQQYNARASIPDHPQIFTRWQNDSALVRRTHAGLLDLPFGSSPGERLDFYPARTPNAPLLVFIHGGWWRSLDKSDFTFVVPGYRREGFNVALTNYTLAPHASIEEIVRQQLRALTWLYRQAERYEFDRDRIVIAGHSAGGHLAAMMLAAQWPMWAEDLPVDLIKAGVLLSALTDLDVIPHVDFVADDLRLTDESIARLSPARMPPSHPAPFITGVGGLESDEFKRQNALIIDRWRSSHREDVPLDGYNHLTICDAFGKPEHALFEATCALLRVI